jgi:GDPmannose 4,6-dehydratase
MYACTGILFNHESERRGVDFVTRKITLGLAKWLKNGTPVELGNLDAKRDWGHAADYVAAMWLMLQQREPEDLVIATGEMHSIREFIETACAHMGRKVTWEGQGVEETGKDSITGDTIIKVNPDYFRPAEVDLLVGDSSRARQKLGWVPQVTFEELVQRMVDGDKDSAR